MSLKRAIDVTPDQQDVVVKKSKAMHSSMDELRELVDNVGDPIMKYFGFFDIKREPEIINEEHHARIEHIIVTNIDDETFQECFRDIADSADSSWKFTYAMYLVMCSRPGMSVDIIKKMIFQCHASTVEYARWDTRKLFFPIMMATRAVNIPLIQYFVDVLYDDHYDDDIPTDYQAPLHFAVYYHYNIAMIEALSKCMPMTVDVLITFIESKDPDNHLDVLETILSRLVSGRYDFKPLATPGDNIFRMGRTFKDEEYDEDNDDKVIWVEEMVRMALARGKQKTADKIIDIQNLDRYDVLKYTMIYEVAKYKEQVNDFGFKEFEGFFDVKDMLARNFHENKQTRNELVEYMRRRKIPRDICNDIHLILDE